MERAKVEERELFDYDDKLKIAAKSDERCAHCGKKVYFGYGATVDHFVPLCWGGTNRMINLMMLCEECNKKKGAKIVNVSYAEYLKEKHKQEIRDYLESYVKSFDYIGRNRIFALDDYAGSAYVERPFGNGRKLKTPRTVYKFHLRYADMEDFERLCDYYEKYLKKYESFISREVIQQSIAFWMRFGCIYFIESNGEIDMMFVFTVKHLETSSKELDYGLCIYGISYYSNEKAMQLLEFGASQFPCYLENEQNIKSFPVVLSILEKDKLADKFFHRFFDPAFTIRVDGQCQFLYISGNAEDIKNGSKQFAERFQDVKEALRIAYEREAEHEWMQPLLGSILTQLEVMKIEQEFKRKNGISADDDVVSDAINTAKHELREDMKNAQ